MTIAPYSTFQDAETNLIRALQGVEECSAPVMISYDIDQTFPFHTATSQQLFHSFNRILLDTFLPRRADQVDYQSPVDPARRKDTAKLLKNFSPAYDLRKAHDSSVGDTLETIKYTQSLHAQAGLPENKPLLTVFSPPSVRVLATAIWDRYLPALRQMQEAVGYGVIDAAPESKRINDNINQLREILVYVVQQAEPYLEAHSRRDIAQWSMQANQAQATRLYELTHTLPIIGNKAFDLSEMLSQDAIPSLVEDSAKLRGFVNDRYLPAIHDLYPHWKISQIDGTSKYRLIREALLQLRDNALTAASMLAPHFTPFDSVLPEAAKSAETAPRVAVRT